MRTDIQFEKIGVQKPSKLKQARAYVLAFLLLIFISCVSVLSVRAYFTAKATNSGELTFGLIEVNLLDSTGANFANSGDESFQTKYVTGILPGSVISIDDAQVKNTGTHEEYVLLNFDVNIAEGTTKELHYNIWYNIAGEEVNINNFAVNSAKASLIQPNAYETTNIVWKVPGDAVDNNYKGATAKVTLTAYGVQANIIDEDKYQNKDLYASYFICKNVADIAADSGFTYLGSKIYGEPLKKVVASRNLLNYTRNVSGKIPSTSMNYTINENGIINVNGTNTLSIVQNYTLMRNEILPSGTYILSDSLYSETLNDKCYIVLAFVPVDGGSTTYKYSFTANPTPFTTTEDCFFSAYLQVAANVTTSINMSIAPQLERGTTATEHDVYISFEDSFDINTQTITRNVGKYEFKGTETIEEGYDLVEDDSSAVLQFEMANCVEVDNHGSLGPICCNKLENTNPALISNNLNEGISVLPDDNPKGAYLRWRIDVATYGGTTRANAVAEFKTWLQTLYAEGNPFTVWYQLETPATEKVLTSKNLYQGSQRLHYQTGVSANTTAGGTITITKGEQQDLTSTLNQQGGDLFEYLKDKPFTVSFKIKLYEDDIRLNTRATISYREHNPPAELAYEQPYHTDYSYAKKNDWLFMSVSAPAISSLSNGSDINQIIIWMCDYSGTPTNSHFEIKDIQIEVGMAPTDFESYDPTIYTRVNGVALRQIDNVKDTYVYDSEGTDKLVITRNVGKYEFTGQEEWLQFASTIGEYYTLAITDAKYSTGIYCVSSHYNSQVSGGGSAYQTHNMWFQSTSDYPRCYIYDSTYTSVSEFKDYLKTEKENGNPVTVWYQLAESKTETY